MHGAIAIQAEKPLDRAKVVLYGLAVGGAVAMLVMRIWLGWDLPLWLDETWTAVIASQTSWSSFWREAWLDCNAPLYYAFMAVWTDVAGYSNWAFRAPSLAFIVAAAAVPLAWHMPGLSREGRLTWAALLFFWWPGIAISLDARVYGLLLLVCVLQTIAFAKLLETPSRGRVWLWAALGSLALVCHYYSIYVTAVQGLILLWLHWRRIGEFWPASLAFVPTVSWTIYHLPRLAEYAAPDVAWYEPVNPWSGLQFVLFTVGPPSWIYGLILVAGLAAIWRWKGERDETDPAPAALRMTVMSGVIALTLALVIGVVRPSLTDRYLTPIVPLTMLGLVLVARSLDRAKWAYVFVCGLALSMSLSPEPLSRRMQGRSTYGYERQSYYLMKVQPDQLIFAWDHPASQVLDRESLRQIGSFFFNRAGAHPETVPVILDPDRDPNPILMAAATGQRPVILWLYNRARRSAAGKYEPRLDLDGPWRCSHLQRKTDIGVMACAPTRLMQP